MNTCTIESPEFLSWIASYQKMVDDYMAEKFPRLPRKLLLVSQGVKYIKITSTGTGSVEAFVDKTTGDVLKAASWRAPAKHARGNIFDIRNGMGMMTPYGPAYLR